MSSYHPNPKARKAALKAALVPLLRDLDARGKRPDIAGLAIGLGCSVSTVYALRRELSDEGLIEDIKIKQFERRRSQVDNLSARIEAVRNAKIDRGRNLTDEEFDELLGPCPEAGLPTARTK